MDNWEDVIPLLERAAQDTSILQALADIFRRNRLEAAMVGWNPEQLARDVLAALCDEDLFLVAEVGGLRFTVEVLPGGHVTVHANGWDDDQWRHVGQVCIQPRAS